MGARAKARRQADKAQASYYKALSNLEALPEIRRAESNNVKQLEESLGDNASYGSKRLAKQADKLGKEINNDEQYKGYVSKYNQRYAQLKDQLAGKSSQRYYVDDYTPPVPVANNSSFSIGMGGNGGIMGGQSSYIGMGGMQQANGGGMGMASIGGGLGVRAEADPNTMSWKSFDQAGLDKYAAKNADRNFYNTKEEALAEATKRMEAYNAKQSGLLGTAKPANSNTRMGMAYNPFGAGKYTDKDIAAMQVADPNLFVKGETLAGIANGWRGSMGEAGGAYSDMKVLADKIRGTGSNQYIQQYSEIANRLRSKAKRDDGNIDNSKGLLSQDLAGADLNNGVIK